MRKFRIILLFFLIALLYRINLNLAKAQEPASVRFTAVGDYGASVATDSVLRSIATSSAQFNLALGDLNYAQLGDSEWCNFVKQRVGQDFPFELITGNHDAGESLGGNIDIIVQCLPHRIENIDNSTDYAKQYYFDYPSTSSALVRIIMISPGVNIFGTIYDFTMGSARYNWLKDTILSARSLEIPWIVVGMHKNCLNIINKTSKSCQIGNDVMNLLAGQHLGPNDTIGEGVDLMLQGHNHSYQRSKQLLLDSLTCPAIPSGTYNPNCVSNSGSIFEKGKGTVFVIVGTGGAGLHSLNISDPEAPYFSTYSGSNLNPTWGYLKVDITSSQLSAQFIPAYNGTFADSFTITKIGPTTPTPTEIPTPIPQTITLNPVGDTYVNSFYPNLNYGNSKTLQVLGTGSTKTKLTYIKYNLGPYAGKTVLSAKLKIKTTSSYAGSTAKQNIKLVQNSSWTETGLKYSNRPPTSIQIGSLSKTNPNTYYQISLSPSEIQSKMGQYFSLALTQTEKNALMFYSRETTTKPQLILTIK